MALLRRGPHLPDDVRSRLELRRGERVVAIGELTQGWAAATVRGLYVALTDQPVTHRAWSDVDGARLDAAEAELTLTWVDGAQPTTLHLADDRSPALARTVHERVQASVVHTEKVTLPSGAVVRVALRRDPDQNLLTQVLGTGDVDLTDPATAELVDAAEARVREAAGLT